MQIENLKLIMMLPFKPAKVVPISSTTQQHILIADITDDMLLTKEGGAAIIMRASALNFSLLSEKDFKFIIYYIIGDSCYICYRNKII